MTLRKQYILLFFVPLLLALPFINRAYFVDDHFFIEIARWIKDNPLHPYDFPTEGLSPNPTMSKTAISLRILNPLLHHYYLAALMKVGGEREWFLRLGGVLFSCLSALLLFSLARRWVKHAFLATLLVLVTPVHWLTSYSLLIDPTMGFFFLLALFAFIRAGETDSLPWVAVSGVSMGLALWSKYTAILIVPLTWFWMFTQWKQLKRKWIYFLPALIAGAFLLAYMDMTKSLYGASHVFAASQETLGLMGFGKILVLLVFFSGGTIAPLVVWGVTDRKDAMAGVLVFVGLAAVFASSLGAFSPVQAILMSAWAVTTALYLVSLRNYSSSPLASPEVFLSGWLIGFLAMMVIVMPWVAARYYVIGVPPLLFGLVRMMESSRPALAKKLLLGTLGVTFVCGLSIAFADYHQAESGRSVVKELRAQNLLEGPNNYYFSQAYTMTYLAREGWKPEGNLSNLHVGDRIITSEVTLPLFWFFRQRAPLRLVATIEIPSRFPLKVMDSKAAAGFYASAWGPLPFSFSTGPWERFHLFEIIPAS